MTGPFVNGWTCPSCGMWTQTGATHVCYGRAMPPSFTPYPAYQQPVYAAPGWICPRCGIVHAPSVLQCTCRPASTENANG